MDNPIAVCIDRNPLDTLDALVETAASIGFAAMEWFETGVEAPWSAEPAAKGLRALMRRHEMGAQYHAPYEPPFDLARDGDALREPESVSQVLSEVLRRAERLGARLTTVHLGTCPPGTDHTEALRNVMEGVLLAVPELEKRRIRLALENHTPAFLDDPVGHSPEEFDWLMENIESEWVGRTLDISHAHIAGRIDDFIARPFDRVFNVHLHDNNGLNDQHLPIGQGTVPWDCVFAQLADACHNGPLTLEFLTHPPEYIEIIRGIRRYK